MGRVRGPCCPLPVPRPPLMHLWTVTACPMTPVLRLEGGRGRGCHVGSHMQNSGVRGRGLVRICLELEEDFLALHNHLHTLLHRPALHNTPLRQPPLLCCRTSSWPGPQGATAATTPQTRGGRGGQNPTSLASPPKSRANVS